MNRYAYDRSFDPVATLMAARQQQIQMLMAARSNFPYSNGSSTQTGVPTFGGFNYGGGDRVTLGGNTYNYGPVNVNDTRMSDGRTIEELFADPYAGTDMGYLKEALDKMAEAQRMYQTRPKKQEAQKGDLRVIAGDRPDGVKPKSIRIDEHSGYDTTGLQENNFHDARQESRFKDGTIGKEYDVTVTWEDGSTTTKRVTLKTPGQIVRMDTSYSY